GQPLIEDAPRVVAAGFLAPAARAGPPGGAGDQSVDGPDQQAPERDHADPHQAGLPPRPAAAVPEHHHDHLLAWEARPARGTSAHPGSAAIPVGGRAIRPATCAAANDRAFWGYGGRTVAVSGHSQVAATARSGRNGGAT